MADARPFYSMWIVGLLQNDNGAISISIVSTENDRQDAIQITDTINNKAYYFVLTDAFKGMVENDIGVTTQKYKWYQTNNASLYIGWTEYIGNCPINLANFTTNEIKSETYLQKVIDSFQK